MKRIYQVQSLTVVRDLFLIAICMAVSTTATAQDTDAFVTNYVKALNASMPPSGPAAVIANAFTENGVQRWSDQGPPQVGRKQIQEFFAGFKDRFADWTHVERSRLVQGNRAVWEGTVEGHPKGSDKSVRLPIVFIFDFDAQGKARETRVYVDVHLIGEQLK